MKESTSTSTSTDESAVPFWSGKDNVTSTGFDKPALKAALLKLEPAQKAAIQACLDGGGWVPFRATTMQARRAVGVFTLIPRGVDAYRWGEDWGRLEGEKHLPEDWEPLPTLEVWLEP